MDDVLSRTFTDLIGRLTGPMTFRLYLQPVMAMLVATHNGLQDARAGRLAYLWAIFSHPEERRQLLADGLKSIGRILLLAIALDVIYQLIVFRRLYPVEAIDVAILLAAVPYALVRGPVNRLARLWIGS